MSALADRARGAIERTKAVRDRVCGACVDSCCLQGTMMGSHDVLRLVKGMVAEPGRGEAVRAGLRERAGEIRADCEVLRKVARLAAAAPGGDEGTVARVERSAEALEELADLLDGPWHADAETLQGMLRYTGLRAMALRELGAVPGANAALANLGREGTSFRFRGRRIAPPRCLFHASDSGCLADEWKPGKCACFFCAGEPNVMRELREAVSFDDFVLGSSRVVSRDAALGYMRAEVTLGRRFVEPKVVLGTDVAFEAKLGDVLRGGGLPVDELAMASGLYMASSNEVAELAEEYAEVGVAVLPVEAVSGSALYELAIGLDRFRAEGRSVGLFVLAREFRESSGLAHPLWTDSEMGQPVGALEILVLE